MSLIVLMGVVITIGGFLISAGILSFLIKVFKVGIPSYRESLKILLLSSLASFIVAVIFKIIDLGVLSSFIIGVLGFLVFHYFLAKYYQNRLGKSLGIYISYLVIDFLLVLLVVVPIRLFITEPFVMKGNSMEPALHAGEYWFVNKLNTDYRRGDIIVFHGPKSSNGHLLKRIIALPGEKITITGGQVFINDHLLSEPYTTEQTFSNPAVSMTLGDGQYYVLGDHRTESVDSRFFGPVTKTEFVGKLFYRFQAMENINK